MAGIQIQGNGGTIAEVDPTYRGARVSSRPLEYVSGATTLGHYSYGGFTGVLPAALAANSEIYQFRWADATRFAVIRRVRISAAVSTTFFAAGVPVQVDLIKSTAWTVAGTLGTAITMSTNLKKKVGMGSSLLAAGDMRISTTAALGAGTKTLEGLSLASLSVAGPITASLSGIIIPAGTVLFDIPVSDGDHPLILQANEGFSIRSVAVPATGTWMAAISVDWAEVVSY